jgi:hypothetical protein
MLISRITAQDGAGPTGTLGEGSYRITISEDTEGNGLGSCEALYVCGSPQEDCSVSAGKVGEVEDG